MAVILETSLGDITIDLYTEERPNCCLNFLKLCKIKYYNFCLFHSVQRNLSAQTGDPTGSGRGGESVFGKLYGDQARYFEAEVKPRIKHQKKGSVSMVNNGQGMHGSQFFVTLCENLQYLDGNHTVFGEVAEGFDVLDKFNEAICDKEGRPYRDIRIFHTVVLDDPFDDPGGLGEMIPDRSPEPTKEQLNSGRIGIDEAIDDTEGKSAAEIEELVKDREAKANAQILELVGDLPDADVKPPDNVLFVCKLNPVTTSEDLEIIFSRFGNILSAEVIKDHKNGESLQYAFIEFEKPEECENAYFKMDNVLIDDRRIHVDFSQSVARVKWKGKGKGVEYQKNSKEEEEERPSYRIKDQSRKDQRYDLVFSDESSDEKHKSHKKKKKKHRHKGSDPEPHRKDKHQDRNDVRNDSRKEKKRHEDYDSERRRDREHQRKKHRDRERSRSPSDRNRYRERSRSPGERDRHRRSRSPSDRHRHKDRNR